MSLFCTNGLLSSYICVATLFMETQILDMRPQNDHQTKLSMGTAPRFSLPRTRSIQASPSHSGKAHKSLIATPSRLEIVVTHSHKRRKHFLIATRSSLWFTAGPRLQRAETAKINRKLEFNTLPVNLSKQRNVQRINRKLFGTHVVHPPNLSGHSPLATSHFRVLHFLAAQHSGRLHSSC